MYVCKAIHYVCASAVHACMQETKGTGLRARLKKIEKIIFKFSPVERAVLVFGKKAELLLLLFERPSKRRRASNLLCCFRQFLRDMVGCPD